jgi:hypothetical protein
MPVFQTTVTAMSANMSASWCDKIRNAKSRKNRNVFILDKLREDVRLGFEDIKAGRVTKYESAENLINEVIKEGQKRLAKK